MMTKKYSFLLFVVLLCCTACNRGKFHITGAITDAKDSTLYFESVALDGIHALDSVKLDAKGDFDFSGKPAKNPEFYRLRIGEDIITLSIDSTETVTVTASAKNMPAGYKVEGSDNCEKIRQLSLLQMKLQDQVYAIQNDGTLDSDQQADSVKGAINQFKDKVRRDYIFVHPEKAYSYYAVFLTLGNYLIFDPVNDRNDVKTYGAVATAWDTFYHKTPRAKNLYNIVIEGMKASRKAQMIANERIDPNKVTVSGVIPISLLDLNGVTRNLTDLKGKVVMLDFTQYAAPYSPKRIMELRNLYQKYSSRGFEIYQVSLDGDESFWKTSCERLPWICVFDPDGGASDNVKNYRVTSMPEYFLINRNNELVARSTGIPNLAKSIEKLLAK